MIIKRRFEKLYNNAENFKNPNIKLFLSYFEKNFIRSKKYPIESWNAFDRVLNHIKLTSNNAEIFNRHFYARFDQSHSGLITFIKNLRDQHSLTEQDIMYQLCNPNAKSGDKKTKTKMENLKTICLNYKSYYGTFYLEAISKTYNWVLEKR